METLKVYRTNPQVKLPKKQTDQSACFDLAFQGYGKGTYEGYSNSNKNFKRPMNNQIVIQPGDRVMVPTGLIMDIPKGYSVRLHARSGASLKQGLVLANAEGVIDSDYVEEVMVILHNISGNAITINSGDRVAQAELVQNIEYVVEQTPARPMLKSQRIGGFGSTGTGISTLPDMVVISVPKPNVSKPQSVEPAKRGRGRPRKNAQSS